ncbi:MAG: hypothetical protein IKJ65_08520, partial [Clostridia bacterium]|nr:hypothetical protein [Clostridia bacterium]
MTEKRAPDNCPERASSHQKSAFFDERGRSPEILLKFPGGDRKGEAFSVAALCENARFLST